MAKSCLLMAWQHKEAGHQQAWYRPSMMTLSNGTIFRVTGPLCGEFTGLRWIPAQRPVMRSFDVFFDLRVNKQLSKQSWGWWFKTLSCSLLRHRNVAWTILSPTQKTANTYWGIYVINIMLMLVRLQQHWLRVKISQFTCLLTVQANIKGNIHVTGSLWGESTSDWWIPLTKGQ